MDPAEEQAAELEALEAIFMDDFVLLEGANAARGARFDISVESDAAKGVKLVASFEHPKNYPDEPIIVTVNSTGHLSAASRKELQAHVQKVAVENVGIPSVFTVCEEMKVWAGEHLGDADDATDSDTDGAEFETRDTQAQPKVDVVSSKAIGTPVTVESFMAWREKFLEEMERAKSAEARAKEASTKLTGRELFEQSKAVVSADSESFWEQEAETFGGETATAD
jgi:hypothetical protein